ncbi:MAG: slipin family protein, partial [Oscillospiraceae bacterium]|nr:slipin family protein [Oscillospiraceae bacterium]
VMREVISALTLDEILNRRDEIAQMVTSSLKEKAASLYIEIIETGIRDIILPGEVRDIMNTVLIAEKRAQANVITRREEVASTRSLLNTAKLMDENKTLYKLKELEYLERICENVGNISVSGGDLLTQLREIVGARG